MDAPDPLDPRIEDHFRQIEHLHSPCWGDSDSAREVALAYLRLDPIRSALGLDQPVEPSDSDLPVWGPKASSSTLWRWLPDREIVRQQDSIGGERRRETIVLTLQERVRAGKGVIDVSGGGIAITLHSFDGRLAVTGAASTALRQRMRDTGKLDFSDAFLDAAKDEALSLIRTLLTAVADKVTVQDLRPVALPSPDGRDLIAALSAFVTYKGKDGEMHTQHVFIDWPRKKIAGKRSLVAAATGGGKVLVRDPFTPLAGNPFAPTIDESIRPRRRAEDLDKLRDTVVLQDLHKVGTKNELTGPRVQIAPKNPLGEEKDPPVTASSFNFSVRSDDFTAVNAYYHCDAMMRMVRGFGFKLEDYFASVQLPLTVEHRAMLPGGSAKRDGIGINAFVIPDVLESEQPRWRVRMLFGLADLDDVHHAPLGLASDPRWVWHEFCHVLLLAATDKTEFDFAHSAGDALAAIMSDPASALAALDRSAGGVTFPFTEGAHRRHDRCVSCGWGWKGMLYERPAPKYSASDPAGYRAEQILSSTLFRVYRAIGGDAGRNAPMAPALAEQSRWSAAHYVVYLIVRAIRALSPAEAVPTNDAEIFAAALQNADVGTGKFEFSSAEYGGSAHQTKRMGGAVHKVVRWAFEQQGLYHRAKGGNRNTPGDPPPVDVFLNDQADRKGGYEWTDKWHASDDALWIEHEANDPGKPEQPRKAGQARKSKRSQQPGRSQQLEQSPKPRVGQPNHVYVNVGNRGSDPDRVPLVFVEVLAAQGTQVENWFTGNAGSAAWTVLAAAAPGMADPAPVKCGEVRRFGPFIWQPAAGKNALFVRVSAPGDRSNVDANTRLACAKGPIPVKDLVPFDNNLGYRTWELS